MDNTKGLDGSGHRQTRAKVQSSRRCGGGVWGIVAAAAAAAITAHLTGLFSRSIDNVFPQTPIIVTVTHEPNCPSVFTAPVETVQQQFDTALQRNPSATVADLNPINGNENGLKKITVQGTSAEKVSLNALELHVDKRDKSTGIAVGQCGAQTPVHFYDADLDSPSTTSSPRWSEQRTWASAFTHTGLLIQCHLVRPGGVLRRRIDKTVRLLVASAAAME